jgi:nondiscriminating aspartyl-tRNA synthetase
VHRIRNFGGMKFLVLRDRGGLAQVVVPKSLNLGAINAEWVIKVRGNARAEPRAPRGVEVLAEHIEVISPAEPPPIDVFSPATADQSRLETLFDHRAISLRMPELLDVFRVQSQIVQAYRGALLAEGFTEIATPKLVLAGAEGGSALFEVKYYEQKAYLAQSPQFYKQMMVGSGLERVFEIGHAYRAEKSETSRHLTEFVSLDFEIGFIQGVQDVIDLLTRVLRAIFTNLRETKTVSGTVSASERKTVSGTVSPSRTKMVSGTVSASGMKTVSGTVSASIPQIDFLEAKRILAEKFGKTSGVEGDLDTEGERLIGQWAQETLDSELLFVTGYARACRPVYTMPLASDPARTASFDLLYRGVEISTGGQRIHRYDELIESFVSRGLKPEHYVEYLEAFKHGMPAHGGMGLGLERLTKQLLRLDNVKEACLFPRDRNRLRP